MYSQALRPDVGSCTGVCACVCVRVCMCVCVCVYAWKQVVCACILKPFVHTSYCTSLHVHILCSYSSLPARYRTSVMYIMYSRTIVVKVNVLYIV